MSFADAIKTFAVINRELPQIIPQQIVNKLSDYKSTGKKIEMLGGMNEFSNYKTTGKNI